jgi:hypothetical protein
MSQRGLIRGVKYGLLVEATAAAIIYLLVEAIRFFK